MRCVMFDDREVIDECKVDGGFGFPQCHIGRRGGRVSQAVQEAAKRKAWAQGVAFANVGL